MSKVSRNNKDGTKEKALNERVRPLFFALVLHSRVKLCEKWDIKKVLDQYRGLTNAEKTKLLEEARENYRKDFKRGKEKIEGWHVPEFLDPDVDPKSLEAKASRQLWDEMCSQRESAPAEGTGLKESEMKQGRFRFIFRNHLLKLGISENV